MAERLDWLALTVVCGRLSSPNLDATQQRLLRRIQGMTVAVMLSAGQNQKAATLYERSTKSESRTSVLNFHQDIAATLLRTRATNAISREFFFFFFGG